MLRAIVLTFGLLCCAGGTLGVVFSATPGTLGLLILGVLIIAGTLFERRYYSNLSLPPGPGWERTIESFSDPSTGECIEVWFNPGNGQRRYVVRK